MAKMNPVVHFELPAKDRNRMAEFYSGVFGWKTQVFGEEMGNYITVSTTETDKGGRPVTPGAINGGLYPASKDDPNRNHPSLVIAVEDVNEHVKKLKKAGAKLLGEPAPIPGVGLWVSFIDTEGNTMSILQPKM